MSTSEKLPVPEFVSQIVRDPNKPANVVLFSGFPGPASESEHSRLYLDPQLSQYVEIPNEAIVYFQPMQPESSPPGGVHVWVQREAQLVQTKAAPERAQAKFFEGPITQAAAGIPAGSPLGIDGSTPACTTPHVRCSFTRTLEPLADTFGGVGGGCDTPACTGPHITCWTAPLRAGQPGPVVAAASIGGPGGGCDTPACTGVHIHCQLAGAQEAGVWGGSGTPACTTPHVHCAFTIVEVGRVQGYQPTPTVWPTLQCTPPSPPYGAWPTWRVCPTYGGCPTAVAACTPGGTARG